MKMRVMHVMAGAEEGGAENIMLESVLALAEAGHVQHVVTRPDNAFRAGKFTAAGIGVDTASFNPSWPFPTRKTIAGAIETFKPDIIEYWMGRAGQFAPAEHRARSLAWYGGYYKLARFRNCEWHVGLTIDLLRHIRAQGVAEDRSAIIHTYADFEGAAPVDRAGLNTPAGAPVALLLAGRPRVQSGWALGVMLTALTCSLLLLAQVWSSGQPLVYALGGWQAPFGIVMVGDLLSASMVVMAQLVLLLGVVYAMGSKDKVIGYPAFYVLFLTLTTGLTGALIVAGIALLKTDKDLEVRWLDWGGCL
jgi:hypothetical protein